jgi:translation initiation factor 6
MAGSSRNLIFNSELIGAFSLATNKVCFVSKGIENKNKKIFEETLESEVKEITISESSLIGIFMVANSRGALLPWSATKEELDEIKSYFEDVEILNTKFNALGNLISANSNGAVLHADFKEEEIELIKDVLKVKQIATLPKENRKLASFLAVNDKGFLASPFFDETALNIFREIFGVEGDVGTVNRGSFAIKLGIVANDKGVVVGALTTGAEIAKIEQIFYLAKN